MKKSTTTAPRRNFGPEHGVNPLDLDESDERKHEQSDRDPEPNLAPAS